MHIYDRLFFTHSISVCRNENSTRENNYHQQCVIIYHQVACYLGVSKMRNVFLNDIELSVFQHSVGSQFSRQIGSSIFISLSWKLIYIVGPVKKMYIYIEETSTCWTCFKDASISFTIWNNLDRIYVCSSDAQAVSELIYKIMSRGPFFSRITLTIPQTKLLCKENQSTVTDDLTVVIQWSQTIV